MQTDRYRNFKIFKLIQLIMLILFGSTFFFYLNFDPLLRNNIYSNRNLLTICVFLWVFMLYSAVCLIADYHQLQKEITEAHKLNQTAYLDPLTGLPNRNGCDVIINKYTLKRDVSSMGCALIELPRIDEINVAHGRLYGDKYIRDFALILDSIGSRYGFVGRNSGNEFLLIIENCPAEKMQGFIAELTEAINATNKNGSDPAMEIELSYILNEQEGIKNFLTIVSTLYSRERHK
ncbi:MAG: GGDEF domain-containing protein [Lachnospiraceae bacterium]|nr:GGDEF domain-containing protein [Lachnospiraceae bacterium]